MGKIEIDHTGSGGGITLSSDGTSLLLGGTAIGGSALELYAENPSSPTAPSATGTNAVAIGSGSGGAATASGNEATAVGPDAIASGYASFAASYSKATSDFSFSAAGGNAQAYGATGYGAVAIGAGTNARASSSVALGHNAFTETGTYSVAIGNSYASGTHSLAAAITNNTSSYGATGANSVAGGYLNKATATNTLCWGGDSNLATSGQAAVVGGWSNRAEGAYSFIGGGRNNRALASYSRAGGHDADTKDDHGKDVWASGDFSSRGDAQTAKRVLRSDTTDATAEVLTSTNGSPNTTNQIILPNNSAYAFHGTIVAREQASAGTDCAAWKVEGLIRREGSAGTTVLVNSATTVLDNTPSWGMALSADTTNGGLKIEVTGAASTNIRWVATIHTSEVTYA